MLVVRRHKLLTYLEDHLSFFLVNTLWLFHIAMDNGRFTIQMIFPLKPPFMVGIFHGYVSHNQMVSLVIGFVLNSFPIYKWLLTPPTPPLFVRKGEQPMLPVPHWCSRRVQPTHRSQEMLVEWGDFHGT